MKKIMKYSIMSVIAVFLLSLSACNVHEWPKSEGKARVRLNLDFNTDIDEYLTIYADDLGRSSRSPEDYDVRYVVKAHLFISETDYLEEAFQTWVFTKDDVDDLNTTQYIDIAPGKYKIMVWTDFVLQGTDKDKFYSPANFSHISMSPEYDGNNDFRDAFIGSYDLDVDYSNLSVNNQLVADVIMNRPLAKYYFVTTDVEEFASRYFAMHSTKGGPNAIIGPDQIDYSKLKLVFNYTGYLPCVFNMHTNRPIDSMTGVSFESVVTDVTSNEATLGFDYILVNGTQSSVAVSVSLYDTDGEIISMSSTINVPLVRGKYTIVKGKFFTQNEQSGVGINPDYDGDHNIIL